VPRPIYSRKINNNDKSKAISLDLRWEDPYVLGAGWVAARFRVCQMTPKQQILRKRFSLTLDSDVADWALESSIKKDVTVSDFVSEVLSWYMALVPAEGELKGAMRAQR